MKMNIFQTIKDSFNQCINLNILGFDDGVTQEELNKINDLFEQINPEKIPMLKTFLQIGGVDNQKLAEAILLIKNREKFEEALAEYRKLVNSDKFMYSVYDHVCKYMDSINKIMTQPIEKPNVTKLFTNINLDDLINNNTNPNTDNKDNDASVNETDTESVSDDTDSIDFESESDYDDYDHKIALMKFGNKSITIEHDPDNIVTAIVGDVIHINAGDYTIEVRSPEFDDTTELILKADGYEYEMNRETIYNTHVFTYGTKVLIDFAFSVKRINGDTLEDIDVGAVEIVKHEQLVDVDTDDEVDDDGVHVAFAIANMSSDCDLYANTIYYCDTEINDMTVTLPTTAKENDYIEIMKMSDNGKLFIKDGNTSTPVLAKSKISCTYNDIWFIKIDKM